MKNIIKIIWKSLIGGLVHLISLTSNPYCYELRR